MVMRVPGYSQKTMVLWEDNNNVRRQGYCGKTMVLWKDNGTESTRVLSEDNAIKRVSSSGSKWLHNQKRKKKEENKGLFPYGARKNPVGPQSARILSRRPVKLLRSRTTPTSRDFAISGLERYKNKEHPKASKRGQRIILPFR
ncbi:hypothetical protein CHS0354_037172 [Potamilus streckersoni]|uniref:Uncharacterized protein n=1 Tax=Potamilus streckersoni TaxID=2493646 RepID=A0AAE0W336_9BIVA|nr:hypothetical protein CHS0354_037172 [Potamilus streckersoni]